MDNKTFKIFLKKKGKKHEVIEKNINTLKKLSVYLQKEKDKELEEITEDDIKYYVEKIELKKQSAKGALYVLMNYFKFTQNHELLNYTGSLRAERTKKTRKIFQIRGFLNINAHYVKKLEEINIKSVQDMLNKGKTKSQREKLAKQLDIPEEAILELVKLSDLTRLGCCKRQIFRSIF